MSAGINEKQESRGARSPSGPLDPEASQPSPPCASPLRTPPAALTPEKPNPSLDPCSFLREIARATALFKGRPPPPKAKRIRRIFEEPGEGIRASDGAAAAAGGAGRSPLSLGDARRRLAAPGMPEERARPRYRSYADCEERDSSPRCYSRRLRYRSIEDCLNDPDFFMMKKKEIAIGKEDNGKTKKKQGSHDVIEDAAEIAEDEATATEETGMEGPGASGEPHSTSKDAAN
ncbi:unnamed protein product [Urochloa humidicola]